MSLFVWSIIDLQHYVSSWCTAQWFSISMHYKMITMTSLDTVCHHTWMCVLSCVWLFATLLTGACKAPLPIEFSSLEYWSGWPFPDPQTQIWHNYWLYSPCCTLHPVTHLFCNWKFVPLDLPHIFHFSFQPLLFSSNHLFALCIYDFVLILFVTAFQFTVSDSTYKWNHTVFVFLHLTLHVAWYPLGPSMLLQIAGFPSFLWLNDIVLFICASFSLFIHPLMATQVVSTSQLLCIMLQWNGECLCFSLSKKIEHFFPALHHVMCSDGLHSYHQIPVL